MFGIPNAVTTSHRRHPARCHHRMSMTPRTADTSPARTCSRFRRPVCCPLTVFYKGRLCHHCRRNRIFGNRCHMRHCRCTVDLVTVGSKLMGKVKLMYD